jgi:hypothetical protein
LINNKSKIFPIYLINIRISRKQKKKKNMKAY